MHEYLTLDTELSWIAINEFKLLNIQDGRVYKTVLEQIFSSFHYGCFFSYNSDFPESNVIALFSVNENFI